MPARSSAPAGGGGQTRGGGAYLGRDWQHPADTLIERTRRKLQPRYQGAQADVEAILDAHLRKTAKPQTSIDRLTDAQQTAVLLGLFAGARWRSARRSVARILYDADRDATRAVNDVVPEAFAEGANHVIYLSFGGAAGNGGQTRGGGAGFGGHGSTVARHLQPYTPDVVLKLMRAGLIDAIHRELDRQRDIAWIEQRLQAIARAGVITRERIADMAADIARRLARGVADAMDVAVQAILRGAWNAGEHEAGLDAARAGLDVAKTWLGIPDARIRDSHRHLHNTTIPLGALFYGLNGTLRYPHDPQAPAAEVMRCRCRMAVHLAGRTPRAAEGLLMPSDVPAYQRWRDDAIREAGGALKLYRAHRDRRG